jgi:hypothetical protein
MPKRDDTNEIPEALTAAWVKRFFKTKFGIPVRVSGCGEHHNYMRVWIQCVSGNVHDPLKYDHEFSPALGNRCMRAVYPESAQLCSQNSGGNVQKNSIGMHHGQWRKVLQQVIEDQRINQPAAAATTP